MPTKEEILQLWQTSRAACTGRHARMLYVQRWLFKRYPDASRKQLWLAIEEATAPVIDSANATVRLTPMQEAYKIIKAKHPESILLVRMGDFYEAFFGDALKLAMAANVALTRRGEVPMAGVPVHAIDSYLAKIEKEGFKAALVENAIAEASIPETELDEQAR